MFTNGSRNHGSGEPEGCRRGARVAPFIFCSCLYCRFRFLSPSLLFLSLTCSCPLALACRILGSINEEARAWGYRGGVKVVGEEASTILQVIASASAGRSSRSRSSSSSSSSSNSNNIKGTTEIQEREGGLLVVAVVIVDGRGVGYQHPPGSCKDSYRIG